MSDDFSKIVPLQEGLEWWYDNVSEIKDKNLPEEQSHALAYETGLQIGKAMRINPDVLKRLEKGV